MSLADSRRNHQPLVDVKVLRQVGRQAGRRRRTADGPEGEVVGRGALHAEVPEVEAVGPNRVAIVEPRTAEGLVWTESPGSQQRWGLHGSQRRRAFHCSAWNAHTQMDHDGGAGSELRFRNARPAVAVSWKALQEQLSMGVELPVYQLDVTDGEQTSTPIEAIFSP